MADVELCSQNSSSTEMSYLLNRLKRGTLKLKKNYKLSDKKAKEIVVSVIFNTRALTFVVSRADRTVIKNQEVLDAVSRFMSDKLELSEKDIFSFASKFFDKKTAEALSRELAQNKERMKLIIETRSVTLIEVNCKNKKALDYLMKTL